VEDNGISQWANLNLGKIGDKITEFGPDFDIDLLGLEDFKIDPSEAFSEMDIAVPSLAGTGAEGHTNQCPNCGHILK
jgi:hypothetical protein